MLEPPIVNAMLFCRRCIQDPSTEMYTLEVLMNRVGARAFPHTTSFDAYLELTNTQGVLTIVVKLVDADESLPPVFEDERFDTYPTPLGITQVVIPIRHAEFPCPGEYRFIVEIEGHRIVDRKFIAAIIQG